jgi:hypothetical protein
MEKTVPKYAVALRTQSVCLLAFTVLALSGCASSKAEHDVNPV